MFAVDSKGNLLWKSKPFNSSLPGYEAEDLLKLSPALNENKKFIVAVSTDSSYLATVSTTNGSIVNIYTTPQLPATDNGVREPPIIAGPILYLIKSHDLKNYYLYSLSLHEVTGLSQSMLS